jgi:hypothetical protein
MVANVLVDDGSDANDDDGANNCKLSPGSGWLQMDSTTKVMGYSIL